ncbi:Fc.00g084310.m01.CDS01 [Cosmosporella sp. VM-42]
MNEPSPPKPESSSPTPHNDITPQEGRAEPQNVEKQAENTDIEKQQTAVEEAPPPPYSCFTTWQKRWIVLAAAGTAFFSPLTAQIYFPALTAIADDLNVTASKINLTVTTYMVFQGITPMFIGSLADSGGRRPAYIICFVIYIGACIGVALAPSYGALLGLRCIQSAGSSSTVALCVAVVADVVTSAERGQYIGFTVVPVILAPSLGPVLGGVLSQYLGWRSIFWFLTILAGICIVLVAIFFPETCREIVGDGSLTPPLMYRSLWQIMKRRRRKANTDLSRQTSHASKGKSTFKFKAPNVLGSIIMLGEKETSLLLSFSSIVFAGFYCIATAMPTLFAKNYGYNEIEVGLMYLPLAAGSVGAALIVGTMVNKNFMRHCAKMGIPYDRSRQQDLSGFPIERARLEVGFPLLVLAAVSTIAWGWAVDAKAHVAVPCVLSAILGVGMIGFNNTTNALLVDIHPGKAGTATAANNLTRCLVGAGASAAIVPMIDAIGTGWAFTLLGGLYIVCSPALLALMIWGVKWRAELKTKEERKKAAKSAKAQARESHESQKFKEHTETEDRSVKDKNLEDLKVKDESLEDKPAKCRGDKDMGVEDENGMGKSVEDKSVGNEGLHGKSGA